MYERVHHIHVHNLHEWDTSDVRMLFRAIPETSSLKEVRKDLKEGLPVFELTFRELVDSEIVESIFSRMIYGGELPKKGSLLSIEKDMFIRPYTSALAMSPYHLRQGAALEVHDTMPRGELVFIIRGGPHHSVYAVMTPDEYVQAVDEGILKEMDPSSRKKRVIQKTDKATAANKAAKSIFAKTGSYARVNSDFPKFPKRRLMRAYMSVTDARLAKEMPPPVEPMEPSNAPPPSAPEPSGPPPRDDEPEDEDQPQGDEAGEQTP